MQEVIDIDCDTYSTVKIIHDLVLYRTTCRVLILTNVVEWKWVNGLPHSSKIREITFTRCVFNLPSIVSQFALRFPNVNTVKTIRCVSYNDDCVSQLSLWTFLKTVFIDVKYKPGKVCNNISEAVELLAENCKYLEDLVIDNNSVISEEVFLMLVKLRGPQLKNLSLNFSFFVGFSYLSLTKCPQLEYLNICFAKFMADADFYALQELTQLIGLRITHSLFDFSSTGNIGVFPKLKVLYIESCSNLTNIGLITLTKSCPVLTKLDISNCSQICGEIIQILIHNCRSLEELHLYNNYNVTGNFLKDIDHYLPNLRILDLRGCHMITEHEIFLAHLHAKQPNLKIIHPDGFEIKTD